MAVWIYSLPMGAITEDFAGCKSVWAVCAWCSHIAQFRIVDLIVYAAGHDCERVERRLRCTNCWNRRGYLSARRQLSNPITERLRRREKPADIVIRKDPRSRRGGATPFLT